MLKYIVIFIDNQRNQTGSVHNVKQRSQTIGQDRYTSFSTNIYMLHEPIDDNDTVIYDDVGPIYRNWTIDITKINEIISIYIISHINIER